MKRRIRNLFALSCAAVLCELLYLMLRRDGGGKGLQVSWTNQLDFIRNHMPGAKALALPPAAAATTTNCSSVFPGMVRGRWEPLENVSRARREEMDNFLARCRDEFRIPRTLQRPDGKCGNLPYVGVPLYHFMWFRAVCNPAGPTPCCYNNRCVSDREAGSDRCTCPTCLDSRRPVHAELSRWVPERAECRPREFSSREACELLKGTTLLLAGDSFVRHLFVALVILLTDNFKDGALKKNAPAGVRDMCHGMYQINGLRCRDLLDQNRTLCGGTVNVTYLEVFRASAGTFLVSHVKSLVARNKDVLLLLGTGIHDNFRLDVVWRVLLQPVVEYFTDSSVPPFVSDLPAVAWIDVLFNKSKNAILVSQQRNNSSSSSSVPLSASPSSLSPSSSSSASPSSPHQGMQTKTSAAPPLSGGSKKKEQKKRGAWRRPKLVWANTHAPGLLKTPKVPAQSFEGVKYYNEEVARRLEPLGVPVLDTFNMTQPLHAVDGTHYGFGANTLKVQFLLNWVKERQDRGEWWR